MTTRHKHLIIYYGVICLIVSFTFAMGYGCRRQIEPAPYPTNTKLLGDPLPPTIDPWDLSRTDSPYFLVVMDKDRNLLGRYGCSADTDLPGLFRMIAWRFCSKDPDTIILVHVWNFAWNTWWMPPGFQKPDNWDGLLHLQTIVRVGPAAY
jgi:hypothetical protein